MDFRRYLAAAAAILVAVGMVSCKKDDDDEETSDYLDGTLTFTVPGFVQPGDTYTLSPSGVSRPSSDTSTEGLGYYWNLDYIQTTNDTVRIESDGPEVSADYIFNVPDTLCSMDITCAAFANGYYNTSASATVVIVRPYGEERSLQGIKYDTKKSFTDPRDGKEYPYTTVGGLDWFIDNLSYEGSGTPYFDAAAMTDIFGMYYTWNEAVSACPSGWRLPSNADFLKTHNAVSGESQTDNLARLNGSAGSMMVDAYFNDTKLWEYWPAVNITNSTRLGFIPTGYMVSRTDGNHDYLGAGSYFACWTSDECNSEQGYYRYIYADKPDIIAGSASKKFFSTAIRCVRDSETE